MSIDESFKSFHSNSIETRTKPEPPLIANQADLKPGITADLQLPLEHRTQPTNSMKNNTIPNNILHSSLENQERSELPNMPPPPTHTGIQYAPDSPRSLNSSSKSSSTSTTNPITTVSLETTSSALQSSLNSEDKERHVTRIIQNTVQSHPPPRTNSTNIPAVPSSTLYHTSHQQNFHDRNYKMHIRSRSLPKSKSMDQKQTPPSSSHLQAFPNMNFAPSFVPTLATPSPLPSRPPSPDFESTCGCGAHKGTVIVDVVFEMPLMVLTNALFSKGVSDVVAASHKRRGTLGRVYMHFLLMKYDY